MDILLIAPASAGWRHVGRARFFNGKTFRFSLLSLLTVAAETPPGHRVTIVDEQVDDIPYDGDWGLVGISCMTAAAPRASEIAGRSRARGIPVVFGGMHPTFRPDEALEHADAAVVGEAEGVWPLAIDAGYARDLFRSLRPLGKRWVGQSALTLTDDLELVRLAADSGCVGLFVGLETSCGANLRSMEKGFHRAEEYRDRIRLLHAAYYGRVRRWKIRGYDPARSFADSSRSKLVTNPPCSLANVSAVSRSANARALGRQRS